MKILRKKFAKTFIFALFVLGTASGIYFLDYKKEIKHEEQKETEAQILNFAPEQINLIEIIKPNEKIVLHKNEKGWALLEPIQDKADNEQIENLIKNFLQEKWLASALDSKQLTDAELAEYGLDRPLATYNIKNNLGQSRRIMVGTQKNFEGNSFIRLDSENKVLVASSIWFTQAENKVIYYREKRLYRNSLADVTEVKVSSLQDHFAIKRVQNNWISPDFDYVLDQNKVRETLRKISEALIQDYIFDGEPSAALTTAKGLAKPLIKVEFSTADANWSVLMNINEADNAVYALTDRPTRLVKLDNSVWEFFGNLSLDSLRDRLSLNRFSLEQVKKIYIKTKSKQMNFIKVQQNWQPVESVHADEKFDESELMQALKKIHDLQISEFIDKKRGDQFKGNEMIILKSESDNLVYQLNWGPDFKMKKNAQEKQYYYARTQASQFVFALEKNQIESLGFDQIYKKKDSVK